MAWYYGTFSCGCEGRTNITGPTKNRQWIADKRFSNLCEECYKAKIEEDNKKSNEAAVIKSKEMELPELIGTEKQIEWANTIRVKMIENLSEDIDTAGDNILALEYLIGSRTKASFWINNRFSFCISDLLKIYKEKQEKEIKSIDDNRIANLIDETKISPVEIKYSGIVEIRVLDSKIEAHYERNDKFKEIVKSLNYRWNGCWNKEISETTGTIEDRAAELGNKLLNAGFVISIQEEEIREKAVKGKYEKECTRWIHKKNNSTRLALSWVEMNTSLYNASRKIPSSKWNKPSVTVDVSYYKEILEFSDLYEFKLTKEAQEYINSYINEFENIEKVTTAVVEPDVKKDGLKDILNSSREVLNDLMEED